MKMHTQLFDLPCQQTHNKLESMRLFSTGVVVGQHHSWATFLGEGGVYELEIRTRLDFLTINIPTKFHHATFNRREVTVLTNKRR